ncbi:TonB-dependent receptor domain-containing protein [Thioflexithrix psekupsensis]|uniref:TonB-dependent receptor domain-containing protein n=1 Tax=Thioflexithrix psekupsensis TaxID=1570016 RepID=UPI000A35D6F0|nr:TonB-dependent receptor [Thioflexithrix psekupsensis]
MEYQISEPLFLLAGVKYQRNELTKGYDVPGYWPPAFSSTAEPGSAIGRSTDEFYHVPPPPQENVPDALLTTTRDVGGYLQATFDKAPWRFNVGVRYDKNSVYGSVVNPRSAIIYHYDENWTFKLLHGRAFQEPAALQLWGGWSGRFANENLKAERVQNMEAVVMHRHRQLLHELSIYNAHYSDVIKEEAENGGERDIFGLEYRLQTPVSNPLYEKDIELYFNYSYARPKSGTHYDHDEGQWRLGNADLGDIARHKWNLGFNVPFNAHWNFNIRANYVGSRELYLRNPLRQSRQIDAYFLLNSALTYHYDPFSVTLKVLNLLDKEYLHPGGETASSGDDFSQRSLGYQNSLIPQEGRSFWLNAQWRF